MLSLTHTRTLQAIRRTQGFTAARPFASPPADYAVQLEVLAAAAVALDRHAAEKESAERFRAADVRHAYALRETLLARHMRPLAKLARAIFVDQPGVQRALRLPRGSTKPESLIAIAEAMAEAAQPYADRLVAAGRPADFVAQLRAAASALREAVQARPRHVTRRIGANASIQDAVVRSRRALRVLDAMMQGRFIDDPALLAEWRSVARIDAGRPSRVTASLSVTEAA
jgi:hypothetical protein